MFSHNGSGIDDVCSHLKVCSTAFTPPLDTRVAIPEYAAKLEACAERFEAWDGVALIGLVAVYCNDAALAQAFVSNVSVVSQHRRSGLGRRLITTAIAHVRGLGFSTVTLRVDRHAAAFGLYRTLGFEIDRQADDELWLSLRLRHLECATAGEPRPCPSDASASRSLALRPRRHS